jgi:hypothetical protein
MQTNDYTQVWLRDLIERLGETEVHRILSTFECPLNLDIENFIKSTAITFTKNQLAPTCLVFIRQDDKPILLGYYTLTVKTLNLESMDISKTLAKKVSKFATYNEELKTYSVPSPLIAQLGKNYHNGYNRLIAGDELLQMACNKVSEVQKFIGGKTVYLECENCINLLNFYKDNGFVEFGTRSRQDSQDGRELIRLLKYL